jgi:YD repeat-containing protein
MQFPGRTRRRISIWGAIGVALASLVPAAVPSALAQVISNRILCPDGRHATDVSQCTPDGSSGTTSSRMTSFSGGVGDESAAIAQMYATRLKTSQEITPGGDTPFGETLSLYTGALNLQQTDIRVPGNGPDIVITRFNQDTSSWLGTLPLPFGDWNASIPRIEVLVNTPTVNNPGTIGGNWTAYGTGQRCSDFIDTDAMWQSWWSGISFIDETGASHEMLGRAPEYPDHPSIQINGAPGVFPIVTQDHWQVGCLAQTANGPVGEAFLAVSPDGTKYWFDYAVGDPAVQFLEPDPDGGPPLRFGRMLARMYVTRIEDRFGNFLSYNYGGDDTLDSISSSDGRLVNLTWRSDGRRIASISVVGSSTRTWSYSYDADGKLTSVTLPDSSTWTFNNVHINGGASLFGTGVGGAWTDCGANGPMTIDPTQSVATIKNPAGLTGSFTTQTIFHARSYVPSDCLDASEPRHEGVPSTFGSTALVARTISGPGVPAASWTYAYSAAAGSHTRDPCASLGTCPDTATTTITSPEGNRTALTYSTRWGAQEGKLKTEQVYQGASTLLRTTTYEYAEADRGPYPARVGIAMINGTSTANVAIQETWTPTILRNIVQQGVTFSHAVAATGLDGLAREINATDDNTQHPARQVITTWHDNPSTWVLGQVARRTVAGKQVERTEFDSSDRPWKRYGHGSAPNEQLLETRSYYTGSDVHQKGTLLTSTDANNHTTTLSSWYRGIPRQIAYADGESISATVNGNGWITSVVDENGYATGYGYDVMGRLASIAYPNDDTVNWDTTTRTFVPVATAEYGIPGGHWRETISTGNARKVTYFDGQWRPLVVREYDVANVAGTERFSRWAYDAQGRTTFAAYPATASAATTGTWTEYDALGRPAAVSQDSELGLLTTQYAYLTAFKTRATNPRGNATTTSFQAWDAPVTDYPTLVAMPEGAYTHITRDDFGKPTRIRRSNSSSPTGGTGINRDYAYNTFQQLCRVTEPETGATLMGYDRVLPRFHGLFS